MRQEQARKASPSEEGAEAEGAGEGGEGLGGEGWGGEGLGGAEVHRAGGSVVRPKRRHPRSLLPRPPLDRRARSPEPSHSPSP